MEKAVAEDLREEDLHAVARELVHVDTRGAQLFGVRNAHAVHAFHDEHVRGAPVPEHLRHQQQIRLGEVAAQLAGVGRLAHQIEFIVQVLVELGDHLARLQALGVGPELFHPRGEITHEREVAVDHGQHARAQHLDRHLAAVVRTTAQRREMHLRNRRARHRMMIKAMEQRRQRLAQRLLDNRCRHLRVKRGHTVLQFGEFIRHIRRQQITPRRQHLTELHEDGPKLLERQAQALAAWALGLAAQRQQPHQRTDAPALETRQRELIQPVVQDDEDDLAQPEETRHADSPVRAVEVAGRGSFSSRSRRLASRASASRSAATSAANCARRAWRTSVGCSSVR